MASSLNKAFEDLFDQQKDTDVTFFIDCQDIKAHKMILCLRPTVLKVMIENPLSYFEGKILISDPEVTYTDFKDFLKFLYTDEIEINRENLEAMLHLGDMYMVPFLWDKCLKFVEKDLTQKNLIEYAEIGLLYADQCPLLSMCLKQIPIKFFTSINSQVAPEYHEFNLLNASHELVLKIVKDSKRNGEFTEEKLFEAVLDWGKFTCALVNTHESKKASLKDVLERILPFIDFKNLKLYTLASTVKENNLLPEKELLDLICKSVIIIHETRESKVADSMESRLNNDSRKAGSSTYGIKPVFKDLTNTRSRYDNLQCSKYVPHKNWS